MKLVIQQTERKLKKAFADPSRKFDYDSVSSAVGAATALAKLSPKETRELRKTGQTRGDGVRIILLAGTWDGIVNPDPISHRRPIMPLKGKKKRKGRKAYNEEQAAGVVANYALRNK